MLVQQPARSHHDPRMRGHWRREKNEIGDQKEITVSKNVRRRIPVHFDRKAVALTGIKAMR